MKVTNVKSIYEAIKANKPIIDRIVRYAKNGEVDGFTPPSSIVGEKNYPKVSIGVLFNDMSNSSAYDDHKLWIRQGYDVSKIIAARSGLINAMTRVNVEYPNTEFMERVRLAIIAKEEVPINANISSVGIGTGERINGLSPVNARLDSLRISDSVKVEKHVEKVFYDKDLKAQDGIRFLYERGSDEDKISRILSVGGMGIKRKIVPTKWAITAVDDTLGKDMIATVRHIEKSDICALKTGIFLGNVFTFIFLAGEWSFELIEAWNRDGGEVMIGESDYELYCGRKEYVNNTAGAYYAIRLAVLEKLLKMKKQFSVIVIREITPEYFAPLGVWVVREGARKALEGEPEFFKDSESVINAAKRRLIYKDGLKKSKILRLISTQTRLNSFF